MKAGHVDLLQMLMDAVIQDIELEQAERESAVVTATDGYGKRMHATGASAGVAMRPRSRRVVKRVESSCIVVGHADEADLVGAYGACRREGIGSRF